MRKFTIAGLVSLALAAGLMASAPAAHADGVKGWAYALTDDTNSTNYVPNPSYSFDSAWTGENITVIESSQGMYMVTFPGLGYQGGTVHVTAFAGTTESCKVTSWGPNIYAESIWVWCLDNAGQPVDSRFAVTFANPGFTDGPMAYVWADQPKATSYTPNKKYQFNSAGAVNTITRTGTGQYQVKVPGLGAAGGHVQVTALGWSTDRCKVASWNQSGTDELVNVRCFTLGGAPVNSSFTMTFVNGTSIVGTSCCYEPGTHFGYAWANQPTANSYVPPVPFQFSSEGGSISIARSLTGSYGVTFPNQDLTMGDVQVTAYGTGSDFCKVAEWTPWSGVQVRCFNTSGAPTDSKYDATFLNSYLIR